MPTKTKAVPGFFCGREFCMEMCHSFEHKLFLEEKPASLLDYFPLVQHGTRTRVTERCRDEIEIHVKKYKLSLQGGKTLRQCIRYTDCDNSRLSQMFPAAMSSFSYRCCNNNLCNSSGAVGVAPPPMLLIGWLLGALVFCL
ncbi:uncharacterized protein LOC144016592 isoform X1 [Festucalex cinctus]